jgi:hypothetical protein
MLPELSELNRIDRLVIVHRSLVQPRTPEANSDGSDQRQYDYEGARHPDAATLKPQTPIFKLQGNVWGNFRPQTSSSKEVPNPKPKAPNEQGASNSVTIRGKSR